MRNFLLEKPHHLGRLVAQLAHGTGSPMMLLRFPQLPSRPQPSVALEGFESFVTALTAQGADGLADEWAIYWMDHRYEVVASGRRHEHPFVTLLRNEPWWMLWEIAYLAALRPEAERTGGLISKTIPGLFSSSIQMKIEWIAELSGLMVYGPVPTESGFSNSAITSEIDRFAVAVQRMSGKAPALRGTGSPSNDRLRRMYYASGRTVDKLLDTSIARSRKALRIALEADLTALREEPELQEAALPTIDSVASVAITRALHPSQPTNTFYGPTIASRTIAIESKRTGDLLVRHADTETRPSEEVSSGEEPAGIELSSDAVDEAMVETLQNVIAQAEERAAQGVLQQFMLMRHWLNDRFARLSPMHGSRAGRLDEPQRNLEDIVDWLLRLFDADFAAIYHSAEGALTEMARMHRSGEREAAAADLNSEHMVDLAGDLAHRRLESSAYRAFWNERSEDVRNWDGEVSDAGMSASARLISNMPRSTLAAPIMVLGKPWGVIELVGFYSNQFDKISKLWLEEASQLVGNALYQTWLLKQITQANVAILTDGGETRDRRLEPAADQEEINSRLIAGALRSKSDRVVHMRRGICREMAELFIADGAALWLNNELWPGVLQLSGFSGVDFEPGREAVEGSRRMADVLPEINIKTDASLVADLMKGEDPGPSGVFSERLVEPKTIRTAREAYQTALWQSGVREITVVPLLDTSPSSEARPVGALALYTKAARPGEPKRYYGRRWLPLIEFAGRHVAMLMRSIALESERQTSLELMFSHEVIGSLRRIKDQFEYLQRNLISPVMSGRATISFGDKVKDIDKATSRIENGITDALDRLDEMRRDGFKMPSAGMLDFRSHAEWDGSPTVLFTAIQSGFNARYSYRRTKNIGWRLTGNADYIRIKIHPRDLETLFYNLSDNALKYSSPSSEARVNIERRKTGNLYVDYFNEAPRLRPGEADRLFKLGFRGQLATHGSEDGNGQGLFITQRLAQSLGVGIAYDAIPIVGRTDVLHRFRVIFLGEMVVYGRD